MPVSRRKISAVVKDFDRELTQLEKFDAQNQKNFSSPSRSITKQQMHFLTEAVFFRSFRSYERFMRDIFLLYCMEQQPISNSKVRSYLKPKDFLHTETIIRSSMRFLDWAHPDDIIKRAETYLKNGFPIKDSITTHRVQLDGFRHIRNHIAHNSKESYDKYIGVIRRYYRTIPLTIPTPGELLLKPDNQDPTKYVLITFFDLLRLLSSDLTNP